jgi:hypothetical protein
MLPLMILQKTQAAEDIVVLVKVDVGWLVGWYEFGVMGSEDDAG